MTGPSRRSTCCPLRGLQLEGARGALPWVPSASGAGVTLSFEMCARRCSPFQGIRFHIRGQGTQVRFDVGTLLTTPEGGLCSACYDSHGIDLWVGHVVASPAALVGSGCSRVGVRWRHVRAVEQLMNLNWRTPVGQPLGIEIDDVQLFLSSGAQGAAPALALAPYARPLAGVGSGDVAVGGRRARGQASACSASGRPAGWPCDHDGAEVEPRAPPSSAPRSGGCRR